MIMSTDLAIGSIMRSYLYKAARNNELHLMVMPMPQEPQIKTYKWYYENDDNEDIIASVIGKELGIKYEPWMNSSRKRKYVEYRMLYMYLQRKLFGKTLVQIGAMFDKGHDTAHHAINTLDALLLIDKRLRYIYDRIESVLDIN